MPSATAFALYGNDQLSPSDEKPVNPLVYCTDFPGMDVAIFRAKGRGAHNMNNFAKGFGGALLTLAFVFGISAATSDTAQAQYRNGQYQRRDRDRNNDGIPDREWRRRNRDDSSQNRQWRRDGDWDRQDRNRRYDNNDSYRRNRGYGNNDGYGNGGYGNQVELNQGYQQGVNTGASDAQRGQSYSPQRSRYYRNASTQAFRQGFVQGYDQGYRQYAGYGNQRNRSRNNGGLGGILGGILGP